MRTTTSGWILALLVVLVATACSGSASDDGDGTTTVPEIEFGEGELPDTVPADFPVPPQAAIGQTLVDRANDRTEVVVRVTAPIESLAQFYDVNLVGAGYVIETSTGSSTSWEIGFRRDGLAGSITMLRVEDGLSQYSIVLTGS